MCKTRRFFANRSPTWCEKCEATAKCLKQNEMLIAITRQGDIMRNRATYRETQQNTTKYEMRWNTVKYCKMLRTIIYCGILETLWNSENCKPCDILRNKTKLCELMRNNQKSWGALRRTVTCCETMRNTAKYGDIVRKYVKGSEIE